MSCDPTAGVGAVGVPVNEGEAVVARKAISLLSAVKLFVFDDTRVSNAVILCVFEAMLFVLVVMLAEAALTLVVRLPMLVVIAVMLLVFAPTRVSNEVILEVAEFTVPVKLVILLVAVCKLPVKVVIEPVAD